MIKHATNKSHSLMAYDIHMAPLSSKDWSFLIGEVEDRDHEQFKGMTLIQLTRKDRSRIDPYQLSNRTFCIGSVAYRVFAVMQHEGHEAVAYCESRPAAPTDPQDRTTNPMTPDKTLAAIDAAFAASPAPPTSGDLAAAVLRVLADAVWDWTADDLNDLADQLDGALSQGEQATAANGDRT